MSVEVLRLYFGSVDGFLGAGTPIHGYVVKHPDGVVLVDTGVPTDERQRSAFPFTARTLDDALGDHGLSVADVSYLVNTHLDSDHSGQNAALPQVPAILRRAELDFARAQDRPHNDCFDFAGARFALLDDEDVEVVPGVTLLFTPGHSPGHQSVLVTGDDRTLLVGDAMYTTDVWEDPARLGEGHRAFSHQFRTDYETWRASADRLRALGADTVHLCHANRVYRQS
jgi:glyoxylase-like metal-dependent hydrolase (beta-lactamase superfamily II)